MSEPQSRSTIPFPHEEVSNDAMQLITIATFNGVCRMARALAENGLLDADQIDNIHDAMTTPLDDPDHCDDDVVTFARNTLEKVLAAALRDARDG